MIPPSNLTRSTVLSLSVYDTVVLLKTSFSTAHGIFHDIDVLVCIRLPCGVTPSLELSMFLSYFL